MMEADVGPLVAYCYLRAFPILGCVSSSTLIVPARSNNLKSATRSATPTLGPGVRSLGFGTYEKDGEDQECAKKRLTCIFRDLGWVA
jgi:hypothetical protein